MIISAGADHGGFATHCKLAALMLEQEAAAAAAK